MEHCLFEHKWNLKSLLLFSYLKNDPLQTFSYLKNDPLQTKTPPPPPLDEPCRIDTGNIGSRRTTASCDVPRSAASAPACMPPHLPHPVQTRTAPAAAPSGPGARAPRTARPTVQPPTCAPPPARVSTSPRAARAQGGRARDKQGRRPLLQHHPHRADRTPRRGRPPRCRQTSRPACRGRWTEGGRPRVSR
eukprot:357091-Chlamydomonas_euryale.AAC.2